MLKIKINNRWEPITNYKELNIVYDYEGEQTLSFDVLVQDKMYKYFQEEVLLWYADNYFLIKKINQRKVLSTITASICLDEWKERLYQSFHTEYKLFSEVILLILPKGWIFEDVGSVTGRRAMTLEGVTDYDILMHCKKLYNVVFEYHTTERKIKVIKPDTFQSRGLYITDELNLTELVYKGDSSTFATRLYAYGKKTEERNDDGIVVSTSYVNFSDINGGKAYVDNNQYSDLIISAYWQDDRYTDRVALLDDAIDKLKVLSKPERSYSCNLVDISRINEEYKCLDFKLYDKVTLLDNISNVHVQHQIVQYVDYPENRNNNKILLSSTFKSIVGTIDGITQNISGIDTEIKRTEYQINEIIRDVQSNTLRINDTYTKGETDITIENVVQQTAEEINISIGEIKTTANETDARLNDLNITVQGLENRLSTTGGNNLIRDSFGLFADGSWDGKYNIDTSISVKEKNMYGAALLLTNNELKQSIKVGNGTYTISFYYAKHIDLSVVKITINEEVFDLTSLECVNFKYTFEVTNSVVDIVFISDTDNACTIINLMLNQGNESMIWSLNSNETYGDVVRIGRGIEIGADGIDVTFNANADIIGFKNKSTGEYVSVFNDVGMTSKEIVVTDKAKIVNLLIQDISGQTTINRIGGED